MFLFPQDEATTVFIHHALKILGKEKHAGKKTTSPFQRSHKGRVKITDRNSSTRIQLREARLDRAVRVGQARAEEETHSGLALSRGRDRGWAHLVVESQHQDPVASSEEKIGSRGGFFLAKARGHAETTRLEGKAESWAFSPELPKQ